MPTTTSRPSSLDMSNGSVVPTIVVRRSSGDLPFHGGLAAAAVAELAQCAVPKLDPCFDATAGGTPSPLILMGRVRDQIGEQLTPLGAMTVAVEFDVPIDVVDEMTQAIVVVLRPI